MKDLHFLICEPAAIYHARSKDYLTSHQLADFRKCPLLYYQKWRGLVPSQDSTPFLVGRAVHVLVLEGRARFQDEFMHQPQPLLTANQVALVEELAASVQQHPVARELLDEGVPEGVVRCDYLSIPCQARLDWFSPTKGLIDLKTCDDLTWFESDIRRYGYVHQLAFYRALLRIVGGDVLTPYLIAVEKRPPYRCGVWQLSWDVVNQAQRINEAAMRQLLICQRDNRWLTGYENTRVFDKL